MNPKPGYKTTEFWLTAALHLLTLLIASGLLHTGSPFASIAAIAMSALTQLQYTSGRNTVKSETLNAQPTPAPTPTPGA